MNGLQGHDARVFDIVSQRCYILCLDGEAQPEKHWRLWNILGRPVGCQRLITGCGCLIGAKSSGD